jgi:hypothetical protein
MRAPMKMMMILPVAFLALTGLSARSLTQDDLNAIADGCSFPRDSVLVEGNGSVGLYDDPSNRDQTDAAQCVYGQLHQWGVTIVGTSLGADGE